jgi:hypothetical protein
VPPKLVFGGHRCKGCSAVSYFSTRVGSIIGAGRLSFRVRDGSGRFPAAVAAVTLFTHFRVSPQSSGGVCFWWWGVAWLVRGCVVADACGVTQFSVKPLMVFVVCKFSAG